MERMLTSAVMGLLSRVFPSIHLAVTDAGGEGWAGVSANRREKRRRVRVRTVRRGRIDGRRDARGAGRGDGQSPVNADEICHIGPL